MLPDARIKDCVCAECAIRMGWTPKDKMVGVWQGKCEFCGRNKPLTSLHHDWRRNNGKQ